MIVSLALVLAGGLLVLGHKPSLVTGAPVDGAEWNVVPAASDDGAATVAADETTNGSNGAGQAAGSWRVVSLEGTARAGAPDTTPEDWRPLSLGERLDPPVALRTAAGGRLGLTNGRDTVVLKANGEIAIPRMAAPKGPIRVLQKAGRAGYDIEPRGPTGLERFFSSIGKLFVASEPAQGGFEVHTPYLVAIVKGTRFDVEVAGERANVSVREGLVQVRDTRGGRSADLRAGQTARAGTAVEGGLSVEGAPGATDSTSMDPSGRPEGGAGGAGGGGGGKS